VLTAKCRNVQGESDTSLFRPVQKERIELDIRRAAGGEGDAEGKREKNKHRRTRTHKYERKIVRRTSSRTRGNPGGIHVKQIPGYPLVWISARRKPNPSEQKGWRVDSKHSAAGLTRIQPKRQ